MSGAPRTSAPAPGDAGAGGFNASALALRYPQLTLFFLMAVAIAGSLAFFKLGQREDPDFTFRGMVIRTLWPGATTEQVDQQVTDRDREEAAGSRRTSSRRAATRSRASR